MVRVENIKDLIFCLDEIDVYQLKKDLNIGEGEFMTAEDIAFFLLDTCYHNVDNLQEKYEHHICGYYTVYEIQYSEEFQDAVYEKNRWMEKFFFLFQLFEYDEYHFDCLNELLFLEQPMYTDFFERLNLIKTPFFGDMIDSSFYHSNKTIINNLYQKERRGDKIRMIRNKMKSNM